MASVRAAEPRQRSMDKSLECLLGAKREASKSTRAPVYLQNCLFFIHQLNLHAEIVERLPLLLTKERADRMAVEVSRYDRSRS